MASTQSRHFHFLSDGSNLAREISRPSLYPASPSLKICSRTRSCTRRSYNFASELRTPRVLKFCSAAPLKSLAFSTTKTLCGMFTHDQQLNCLSFPRVQMAVSLDWWMVKYLMMDSCCEAWRFRRFLGAPTSSNPGREIPLNFGRSFF